MFLFLSHPFTTISDKVAWFLQKWHVTFVCSVFCWFSFGGTAVIVGIVNSPSFSKPRSSNSLSRCATIWSYVPFSRYARLSDHFK